jgi:outer membrane protein
MAKINRLSVLNTVLLFTVIIFLVIHYIKPKQDTIVYVDNIKLFNGFNMTRDIKAMEEATINKQAKILDSLYLRFNELSDKEKARPSAKNLQQQIAIKSKKLQEQQDAYINNLNVNVWKRLNSYIEAYAQAKGYSIILGTSGKGNVMYANQGIDVTSDVLEFSNKNYEGN